MHQSVTTTALDESFSPFLKLEERARQPQRKNLRRLPRIWICMPATR